MTIRDYRAIISNHMQYQVENEKIVSSSFRRQLIVFLQTYHPEIVTVSSFRY